MTTIRYKGSRATAIALVCALSMQAFDGCSTVSVVAKQASKADDIMTMTRVSLWWGASDAVENIDCKGNGLQIVSVKTNWLYSLCTVVTLGAVVPVDVACRCTSVPLEDGGTLEPDGR